MKQLLIIAGLAALASTAAADAKPDKAKGRWHANHCQPGMKYAKCLPPGQAKKLYRVGYKLDRGYNGFTPYNQIPYELRDGYNLDDDYRYVYDRNYIYQVDPTTMIVSQVLNAILR